MPGEGGAASGAGSPGRGGGSPVAGGTVHGEHGARSVACPSFGGPSSGQRRALRALGSG